MEVVNFLLILAVWTDAKLFLFYFIFKVCSFANL